MAEYEDHSVSTAKGLVLWFSHQTPNKGGYFHSGIFHGPEGAAHVWRQTGAEDPTLVLTVLDARGKHRRTYKREFTRRYIPTLARKFLRDLAERAKGPHA